MKRFNLLAGIVLFIVALIFSLDLFMFPGRSITFDAHVHITTIAQFFLGLSDGEFPVTWANGFANYGLPIPLVAHQTTSYAGALFQVITHNPVTAYNLVVLTGAFLSSLLAYVLFSFHIRKEHALFGALLFSFAPYRIVNIYVRGALPEFFASIFLPLTLIGVHLIFRSKERSGVLLTVIGILFLLLTHPMMLVISSVILIPYGLYLAWPLRNSIRPTITAVVSALIALLLSSYYILPLLYEIKYFTYGSYVSRFREGQFLSPSSFLTENWAYFGATHPGPRNETLVPGIIELLVLIISTIILLWHSKKIKVDKRLVWTMLIAGCTSLFLTLPMSRFLYLHFSPLNNIQYPWRMLSAFMIVPPFLLGLTLHKINKLWIGVVLIIVVAVVRIPQLYGKNYLSYDPSNYAFTTANLHTANMNTVWMGNASEYPKKTTQVSIVDGAGEIRNLSVTNSTRSYTVTATTPVRLVDYTFYFPGWKIFIDGIETQVQFQDPAYRGVITYTVPQGTHTVSTKFTETKIRILGKVITGLGAMALITFLVLIAKAQFLSKLPLRLLPRNR